MDGIDIRGYEYLEGGRGEHRWDELTKRDGDLQAFVNTPFLFFSTLFRGFYQTFFFSFVGTLFRLFLPTFGSLL